MFDHKKKNKKKTRSGSDKQGTSVYFRKSQWGGNFLSQLEISNICYKS